MNINNTFYAINPTNNEQLEGTYTNAIEGVIDKAVQKATQAFGIYRKNSEGYY